MATSMERVSGDFSSFCQRVDFYMENITNLDRRSDSCVAAYEGLYRLMQRIKKELVSGELSNAEKAICFKIFDDTFLSGLVEIRTIGTHVVSDTAKKQGYLQMYVPSGSPVRIHHETSAGALFADNVFRLPGYPSGISEINHRDNLVTAKQRIAKWLCDKT